MMEFSIDKELLPVRFIYFSLLAGLSCFLPYATLYCSHLGLTPSQIGIIWGIEPLMQFLCAPLWGSIADKYSKHKQIFMLCLVFGGGLYLSLLFIPPYHPPVTSGDTRNCSGGVPTFNDLRCPVSEQQVEGIDFSLGPEMEDEVCSEICDNVANDSSVVCDMDSSLLQCDICSENSVDNTKTLSYSPVPNDTAVILPPSSLTLTCKTSDTNLSSDSCNQLKCCKCPEIQSAEGKGTSNAALTFGLCMCLVLAATIFQSVQMPFVDALCFGLLGERAGDYGKQRLWGSIGWGIFAFVSGIAVDKYNGKIDSDRTHYDPIFYMYISFIALTFLCTVFMKFPPHQSAKKIRQHIFRVLRKAHVIAYFGLVIVMGIGFGITGSFLFLFMDELNSTYLIMGLSQTITTIAEIPCFFVSGPVIKRLGHNGVFCLALFAFCIRFLGFSIAPNPWVILPFQVLHGITFGLFWAAAVSYATIIAPEGMVATLQTIVSSLHFGVGKAIGTALAGFIYEKFGSRNLFRAVAGLCMAALLIYWPLLCCLGIKLTGKPTEDDFRAANKETLEKTKEDDKEADLPLQEKC